MVQRIATGRPPAHVAAEMGVSATTAWKWWHRWQAEGPAGLIDLIVKLGADAIDKNVDIIF